MELRKIRRTFAERSSSTRVEQKEKDL